MAARPGNMAAPPFLRGYPKFDDRHPCSPPGIWYAKFYDGKKEWDRRGTSYDKARKCWVRLNAPDEEKQREVERNRLRHKATVEQRAAATAGAAAAAAAVVAATLRATNVCAAAEAAAAERAAEEEAAAAEAAAVAVAVAAAVAVALRGRTVPEGLSTRCWAVRGTVSLKGQANRRRPLAPAQAPTAAPPSSFGSNSAGSAKRETPRACRTRASWRAGAGRIVNTRERAPSTHISLSTLLH